MARLPSLGINNLVILSVFTIASIATPRPAVSKYGRSVGGDVGLPTLDTTANLSAAQYVKLTSPIFC